MFSYRIKDIKNIIWFLIIELAFILCRLNKMQMLLLLNASKYCFFWKEGKSAYFDLINFRKLDVCTFTTLYNYFSYKTRNWWHTRPTLSPESSSSQWPNQHQTHKWLPNQQYYFSPLSVLTSYFFCFIQFQTKLAGYLPCQDNWTHTYYNLWIHEWKACAS